MAEIGAGASTPTLGQANLVFVLQDVQSFPCFMKLQVLPKAFYIKPSFGVAAPDELSVAT